jgi:hypothetical protein
MENRKPEPGNAKPQIDWVPVPGSLFSVFHSLSALPNLAGTVDGDTIASPAIKCYSAPM